ncbi:hypothetical protein EJ04DRAFT_512779 [Polyplosphaeria fusca]|uniref:Uncharacterized protein n=1 Tax=Polyplosphaeria fusca TaxID=682080 RepID=A0A9P4V362_9PLEO|nr:hypothetical protein EJ04DRAFT_512779 [Polyplosphaeria fusca]
MAKALEENTLIQLLDRCGWSDFRRQLPRLEVFLATDPIRRPSVYRLVQFLRTGSTNPIPCLGRDYGYKNCYNRDQVKRLNVVYSHILKDCSPQELHAECIQGTLRQFATEMGAKIEEKDLRLFETVARFSGGGYDDDRSSTSLNRGGLFRRSSG